jgi:hypothetical protein
VCCRIDKKRQIYNIFIERLVVVEWLSVFLSQSIRLFLCFFDVFHIEMTYTYNHSTGLYSFLTFSYYDAQTNGYRNLLICRVTSVPRNMYLVIHRLILGHFVISNIWCSEHRWIFWDRPTNHYCPVSGLYKYIRE